MRFPTKFPKFLRTPFFTDKSCWSLFLVKLQAEKILQQRCFPMHIANFLTTSIF